MDDSRKRGVAQEDSSVSLKPVHRYTQPGFVAVWQVFVDDAWGQAGCTWCDYSKEFNEQMEHVFQEQSEKRITYKPGQWYTFVVDLEEMTQRNMDTGMVRGIRRTLVPIGSVAREGEGRTQARAEQQPAGAGD